MGQTSVCFSCFSGILLVADMVIHECCTFSNGLIEISYCRLTLLVKQ